MLLDTREKDEQIAKEGFNPNVVNKARSADISGGGVFGWWFLFVLCWILLIIPGIIMLAKWVKKGNWFRTQQEKINESASGIDIQLQKRRDVLVKLVDATQTSINFEKKLLTDITSLRNVNHFNANTTETTRLDNAARGILATFENYPNLKSTDTIRDLMQSADYIEREIAASRRLYNARALSFNQAIQQWPWTAKARSMKLTSFSLFAASDAAKQDVSLKMDA